MSALSSDVSPPGQRAGAIITPLTLTDALRARADHPEAVPIQGGTDLMVEMNFGRREPATLLDLSRVSELREWRNEEDVLRLGAGVTFARLERAPFTGVAPALAQAARTVGSPQIRNRGTIGGNLATCSPAGDSWPALVAGLAEVEVASVRGTRFIGISDFAVGPKRSALAADELILSVSVPISHGPQTFMKVGPRNAMVISVTSLALVVDEPRNEVRVAYGSAGPVVGLVRMPLPDADRLPDAVANACSPIDDVRGTAEYRRHALRVLTKRALERCQA
ncbi:MAG: FAD-binding protein [Hyphomicrobiales bacterium]|nr:MAG: FAD-binding protein [Hyphomicrobiales bacterium]